MMDELEQERMFRGDVPEPLMDAQQIRDSMLSVSGELDKKVGGPSSDLSSKSRGIYTKVLRNTHDPLLEVFDEPDGFFSVATRTNTTTATQNNETTHALINLGIDRLTLPSNSTARTLPQGYAPHGGDRWGGSQSLSERVCEW